MYVMYMVMYVMYVAMYVMYLAMYVMYAAIPLPAYRRLFLIMTYVHLWTLLDSISYPLHVRFRLFACTSLPTCI